MNMVKQEFKHIFKNKILLISVIAITFIPILYAGFFDKSVWDPYGRAKDLPVAVVNEDVETEMLGQKVDVGKQVVDQLKENKDLKWEFVSKEKADKGMKDLYYYMIIEIPKDFSKNATSLLDKNPQKMNITYTTNGSLNYIGEEISEIGATTLNSQVRDNVTEAYVTALNEVGKKAVQGIGEAASGSNQLAAGSVELGSGLGEYTTGVGSAHSGSNQLAQGTSQLAGNIGPLSGGVSKLTDGASQLNNGLGTINQHLQPLSVQATQLKVGLDELSEGSRNLETALANVEGSMGQSSKDTIEANINQINNDLDQILSHVNELNQVSLNAAQVTTDLQQVSTDLNHLEANIVADSSAVQTNITSLINAQDTIDEGIRNELIHSINQEVTQFENNINEKISSETAKATQGLDQAIASSNALVEQTNALSELTSGLAKQSEHLSASIAEVEKGTNEILGTLGIVPSSASVNQLVGGLEVLTAKADQVMALSPKAFAGADQLAGGSNQLSDGLNQLYGQMPTLSSGVNQLNSGAGQLQSGLGELNKNSPALMSGISQLKDGSKELATALDEASEMGAKVKLNEKNINMFSDATKLTNKKYSSVSNYGEALAPYIMSLALFVGCLVFNFVFPIRRVSIKGQSSRDWWLSKVAIGFVVSTGMALIEATIMIALKLQVDYLGKFYLMALISAWSYMFIVMFLAMTFDNPGRFIAMILLVLQLGGAGGTFPMPLTNGFFNAIHPYLPMSYSIYGLREAISGGIGQSMFNKSTIILVVTFIVFVILLRLSMAWLQKRHEEGISELDDNQMLQELEK
ncbi:YhgE/Pip family protein [Vagococcus sp.]|uniref:YhgE/Pip domain-containing protein n=1 Tax=Vagococcus sp. TaxID=1933889 RepID=UPI003F95A6E3